MSAAAVDRVRARIGYRTEPREWVVEAGHVRRFAEAIGDPDPRWEREVPPTFLVALTARTPDLPEALEYGRGVLNAGDRFEYERPVRVGETLSVSTRLADAYEKQGSTGGMLFLVWDTEYRDAAGSLVARVRGTRIRR